MYTNILIPVALDHEALIPRKLDLARNLLAENGQITLLTVLENVPGFVAEFVTLKEENHLVAKIQAKLEAVHGGQDGIRCIVETGKAGVVIARHAETNDIDLIIVGSHRPGVPDYFLGSTAARVARRAKCSVHILR